MTLGSYTTVSIFHIGTHAGLSKIQNQKKTKNKFVGSQKQKICRDVRARKFKLVRRKAKHFVHVHKIKTFLSLRNNISEVSTSLLSLRKLILEVIEN